MSNEKKKLKYGMLVDILSLKDKSHWTILCGISYLKRTLYEYS